MTPRYHIDANIVLRFLRNDHPEYSPAARRLFERAEQGRVVLALSAVTVAEIFYVLARVYRLGRVETARALALFLSSPTVEVADGWRVLDALQRVERTDVDFGDAYLAATGLAAGEPVASFDRDLERFADITLIKPK